MSRLWFAASLAYGILSASISPIGAQQTALDAALKAEGIDSLAAAARQEGDAARGAIVFYQPHTTCAKCHVMDGAPNGLGPDLTALPQETSDRQLVESLLEPSKTIRKGFELTTVATRDGRTISGLVVGSNEGRIVIRELSQPAQVVAIVRSDIERQSISGTSAMPAGLANQLASRQQFLD